MSGRTVAQKILARASGSSACVGETVVFPVDAVLFHDATGPLVIEAIKKAGGGRIAIPEKTFVVFDHAVPASTALQANRQKVVRDFVRSLGDAPIFFADAGEGICHQVLYETGRVRPGHVVIGADSHTCTLGAVGAFATGMGATDVAAALLTGKTWLQVPESIRVRLDGSLRPGVYAKDLVLKVIAELGAGGANERVLEYCGPGTASLGMDERLTLSNMAVEAGATTAIFPYDALAREQYGQGDSLEADPRAAFVQELSIDLDALDPQVAVPHGFGKVVSVRELGQVPVAQAFLGTCTNGRLSDLRAAASILKGRKVHPGCRLIVVPASRPVLKAAMAEGLMQIFIEAGAITEHPNCGPCLGFHEGVLADGEACISSSSRNYKGRMGNPNASIYLGSPATVAASAVAGRLADPRELL